jgi:AGCS family alanine or glycine:cation symporter
VQQLYSNYLLKKADGQNLSRMIQFNFNSFLCKGVTMYETLHNWIQFLLGWPLLIYVGVAGIICTYMLRGIQVFGLIEAFQATLFPKREKIKGDISPLQAFFSTVNASIGNGSIAGMATAVYSGGPGAAFWVLIFGFLLMAVRFAEVYISTDVQNRVRNTRLTGEKLGGPMLYLKEFRGGNALSMIYAVLCFFFGVSIACCWQANSIQLSLYTTIGLSPLITAPALFFLVLYIVCGGAGRIAFASALLFPLKVGLFLLSAIAVLIYHSGEINDAQNFP